MRGHLAFDPVVHSTGHCRHFLLARLNAQRHPTARKFAGSSINNGICYPPKIRVQDIPLVPLIDDRMGCIRKELLQVEQQHPARTAILAVMPCQLLFDALDLPVQSLTNPACTVVIDHAGVVKRLQHFLADDLVDLSVCNMRSVNPTNLAAFADREMNVFLRPPPFGQNKPPLLRCVGKQMPLKVLRALLPAYTVAAFPAVFEHRVVAEHFFQRTEGGTTGFLSGSACCPAALVSCFMALLTCHKSIRSSYR